MEKLWRLRYKTIFISLCITIMLLFGHCKVEHKRDNTDIARLSKGSVTYAKGFDIIHDSSEIKLVIKRTFQDPHKPLTYTLKKEGSTAKNELKIPIKSIVVTSTTHIPMLELLGEEDALVGFPNTKYISSKKTRKKIDNGEIEELGIEQNINIEKLIELQPELLVGFSLYPNSKLYNTIKKTGIPIIFNGDWLEETPLGRAEWIKFFGVLLGKEKQADSIFKAIEFEYLQTKKIAQKNTTKATILSGSMFRDVWSVPAGNSYNASFFKDANLNYLWSTTTGTGSLQLSFESVLDKAKDATYWINCGMYKSKEELANANIKYTNFDAYKTGQIYSFGHYRGPTGGLIYYELSPVRPDLVLKDLVKITNPSLLPNYKLTFYRKL